MQWLSASRNRHASTAASAAANHTCAGSLSGESLFLQSAVLWGATAQSLSDQSLLLQPFSLCAAARHTAYGATTCNHRFGNAIPHYNTDQPYLLEPGGICADGNSFPEWRYDDRLQYQPDGQYLKLQSQSNPCQ